MNKLISLVAILAITSSILATDTIILRNRRTLEGTLKGASGSMIYIDDLDGVTSAVPKALVKSAFSGKKDVTLALMSAKDYTPMDDALSPLIKTGVDSVFMDPSVLALNSIDGKLTMIAIPMWVSLIAGLAALLIGNK